MSNIIKVKIIQSRGIINVVIIDADSQKPYSDFIAILGIAIRTDPLRLQHRGMEIVEGIEPEIQTILKNLFEVFFNCMFDIFDDFLENFLVLPGEVIDPEFFVKDLIDRQLNAMTFRKISRRNRPDINIYITRSSHSILDLDEVCEKFEPLRIRPRRSQSA